MRVGISGTHGTGKTTLTQALCARLPGHVAADEPYNDPLDAWGDVPVLELSGPLDGRLDAVLAAIDQSR